METEVKIKKIKQILRARKKIYEILLDSIIEKLTKTKNPAVIERVESVINDSPPGLDNNLIIAWLELQEQNQV